MFKSHNERVILICFKNSLVLLYDSLELIHVSRFDTVYNLEIWRKWLLKERLTEDLSVWNLSHEQFNNNLKFLNLDSESFCSYFWSFSQWLDKSSLRFRIFKLNSLDSTKVVEISGVLIVGHVSWEIGFDNELTSLFVEILRNVWSKDDVGGCSLTNQILMEARSLVWLKHDLSNIWKHVHLFVGKSYKVHCFGTKMIKGS